MSDQTFGVAVLDKTKREAQTELLFFYVVMPQSGGHHILHIPIRPAGAPKTHDQEWEYRIDGDVLHVWPSVNWVGVWHNTNPWQIKFSEFDPSEYKHVSDKLRRINGKN